MASLLGLCASLLDQMVLNTLFCCYVFDYVTLLISHCVPSSPGTVGEQGHSLAQDWCCHSALMVNVLYLVGGFLGQAGTAVSRKTVSVHSDLLSSAGDFEPVACMCGSGAANHEEDNKNMNYVQETRNYKK